MTYRKKVFTMQGVGIPVSAVGQGGKAVPQPSSSSDRTSLANSSNSLMNQRCAACSRFAKSVNQRKQRVESVDEANAFSLCFGKSIVLNDVLCCNCRILLPETENCMIIVDLLIIEEHFIRAMIFRHQATKIQNLRHA